MFNLTKAFVPCFRTSSLTLLPCANVTRQLSSGGEGERASAVDEEERELDTLFKKVVVHVSGHDNSVLGSYTKFVQMACKELGVNLSKVEKPERVIERWSVLKSRFSNRKHMRQYEMRTHFRLFELTHLTGSTSDTILEYIQRNLPEGCAMKVEHTRLQNFSPPQQE